MKLKIILLTVLSLTIGAVNSLAQDIHFSNITMANMYNSIGSVGEGDGTIRATTHYRNQWPTVGKAYSTVGLAADYRLDLGDGAFGFGLITNRDQAGEVGLTRLQMEGAVTYHQRISANSYLSGGVQGGIIQHSIDESKAQWQNQFDGKKFDPTLPSNEAALFQPFINYTFGTGVQWTYDNSLNNRVAGVFTKTSLGFSVYHALASQLDYNAGDKEYTRMVVSGSATFALDKNTSVLEPAFVYQKKGPANELVIGMLYRYIVRQPSKYTGYYNKLDFAFGSYYRFPNDAIVPTFHMNYDNFQFGLSYDINISPLIQASSSVGGIEFSLRYSF